MTAVIEASGLTRLYSSRRGISALDLRVHTGEIFGYLGPNGSGKTTTIRLMLGFLRADKGEIKLFGKKVSPGSTALRASIGYVPGEASLPESMTGRRALAFYEKLNARGAQHRDWLCSQLHLQEGDLHRPIRTLSRGTKQKIAIVQALQHDPELIILDEPTSGLDPLSQEAFFDVLHDLRDRGRTVFFSSHVLSEVQRLADRVAVLRDGHKVLESTMMDMAARADRLLWIKPRSEGEISGETAEPGASPGTPPTIPGARFIRRDFGGWLLYLVPGGESHTLLPELMALNPADFRLEPALEESFLKLYGVQVRSLMTQGDRK
jgi:ABC-2 type transport system ATP-binding protein